MVSTSFTGMSGGNFGSMDNMGNMGGFGGRDMGGRMSGKVRGEILFCSGWSELTIPLVFRHVQVWNGWNGPRFWSQRYANKSRVWRFFWNG